MKTYAITKAALHRRQRQRNPGPQAGPLFPSLLRDQTHFGLTPRIRPARHSTPESNAREGSNPSRANTPRPAWAPPSTRPATHNPARVREQTHFGLHPKSASEPHSTPASNLESNAHERSNPISAGNPLRTARPSRHPLLISF